MKPRLRELQALRGIALLAVLFFHAGGSIFRNGYLGVDIFFVISGYVIAPQIREIFNSANLRSKLLEFYQRRIYRLFPALYVVIIAFTPLLLFLGDVRDLAVFWNQSITSLSFTGNVFPIFSKNGYHEQTVNPYLHTWSLGVEFQIYLILPLLIFVLIKKMTFNRILYSACLLSFVSYLLLEYLFALSKNQLLGNMAFYLPVTRFWEFGLGALLSGLALSQGKLKSFLAQMRNFMFVPLGVILFVSSFGINEYASLMVVLCISGLVLITISETKTHGRAINTLAWLGDRSYSLYLVHLPLIYLAKYSPILTNIATSEIRSAISVLFTIVIGFIIYESIENQFRKKFIGYTSHSYYIKDFLITISVVILTFATFLIANKSIYPINPLESFNTRRNTEWDINCALESRNQPCIYNKGNGKSILLIGDSHAAMFGKTLVDISLDKNLTVYVWAAPACQYFTSQVARKNSNDNDSCLELNQIRESWVTENKPDYVIFSLIDSKLNFEKYYSSSESFMSAIIRSMESLSGYTNRKAFILPTPKLPDFSLLQYLIQGQKFLLSKDYFQENAMWRQELASSDFYVIETVNELCPQFVCKPVVDGVKIWEDTTHISNYGSNLIEGQLKDFLKNG
jgi:peptidoglycan/LPS O-acetylase OafA/YrhL